MLSSEPSTSARIAPTDPWARASNRATKRCPAQERQHQLSSAAWPATNDMQLCGVLSSGGAAASDTYERILSTVGNESRPARLCWPRGTTSGPGTAGASRSSRQRCRCGFKHGGAGSPWEASNTAALVARGRQCLRNAMAMSAHCIQESSSTNG